LVILRNYIDLVQEADNANSAGYLQSLHA